MSVTQELTEKRYFLDEWQTETVFESIAVVLIFQVFSDQTLGIEPVFGARS